MERVFKAAGFTFLFARSFHPFMKPFGPIRLQLGIPTIFNILGPLLNPAKVNHMVAGVFAPFLGPIYVESLKELGFKRALVVHGTNPPLDELTIAGSTLVWELKESGEIQHYEFTPEQAGLKRHPLDEKVASGTPQENAEKLINLLSGNYKTEPALTDFLLLNAGAALYIAGKVSTIKEGAEMAFESMVRGKALERVKLYAEHCKPQ